jgi:hypothetical protein
VAGWSLRRISQECQSRRGYARNRRPLYATAIAQRYQSATPQAVTPCAGAKCPAFAVQILTEEGPVIVPQWADNTVLVSESFDQMTAGKLVDALRERNADVQADNVQRDELGSRSVRSARVFRVSGPDRRQDIARTRERCEITRDGLSLPSAR